MVGEGLRPRKRSGGDLRSTKMVAGGLRLEKMKS